MTTDQYGVTNSGFVIKPFSAILADKFERVREMFGADVDLRSTSALRKILDIASFEDGELWKRMEQLYYSNFVSTASGDALDLLGDDVGIGRQFLAAMGRVKFKLSGEASGRVYRLPIGTIVETDAPIQSFRTLTPVSLSDQNRELVVDIAALTVGPSGNVAANAINKINPVYAQQYLNLGGATIGVQNETPTTGGDQTEDDVAYRDRQLGTPRTVWTLESVRHAVKNVAGVRDCRLFDTAGGADISLSIFSLFLFNERRFGTQRVLGTPYFFDILVALDPGVPWESAGGVPGVRTAIEGAIRDVRPISIFPNLRLANNVLVGLRASVLIKSGLDKNAVLTSIKEKLEQRVNALGLGSGVLYSEVLVDCMDVPGVLDVQGLHLRRCPPLFQMINFGVSERFQIDVSEAAVGENLVLLPDEIGVFNIDAELIDVELSDR